MMRGSDTVGSRSLWPRNVEVPFRQCLSSSPSLAFGHCFHRTPEIALSKGPLDSVVLLDVRGDIRTSHNLADEMVSGNAFDLLCNDVYPRLGLFRPNSNLTKERSGKSG